MDIRDENWLPIAGFEGLYEVSDLGRVRSLARTITDCIGRKRILGPRIRKLNRSGGAYGYVCLNLTNYAGKRVSRFVHRLVAEAFIPNPDNRPEVNHLREPKTNNRVGNLEWATRLKNTEHAVVHNLVAHGENKPNHVLSEPEVREMRALAQQGLSYAALARLYDVHPVTVSDAVRRKTWARVV